MPNSIATKLGCGAALVALLCVFAGCSSGSAASGDDGGNDSESASDAGTDGPTFNAYDAGVTKCGAVECFRCGNSTCPKGNYCQADYAAVPNTAPMVSCAPVPSECAATPTCGCLSAHGATVPNAAYCYEPPACEDDGAGHVTLECHFY